MTEGCEINKSVCIKIFLSLICLLFLGTSCSSKKTVKTTPPFEPESALTQANDKIKGGLYEEAREILSNIKAQDSTGKYAALAQIRTGDSYFEEGLYEEAAVEYEQFLRMHPHHKYAYYAQYQLAMGYYRRIKTPDVSYSLAQNALEEFNKLLKNYPRNPYISIAENRIKTCERTLAEYEFYVGEFYFKKGSYAAAASRFNDMLQNYPDSKKEPEALYYLGLSYKNMDEQNKALTVLSSLIEKYPATSLSQKAKEVIAVIQNKEK